MPSSLDVTFHDPEAGTLLVTVQSAGETAQIPASYHYNSFLELTLALHRMLFTQGESVVTWRGDQSEVETRFVRIGDTLVLEIDQFPNQKHHAARGRRLLFASGGYAEICLPFWRALRSLQSRFTEEELLARWQGRFPKQEVARLGQDVQRELHLDS